MARIVKEQEYALRRNAILNVAQRLVVTRGYEQMTIQDVLDDLQISKGAFYHYFDSKQALLEALLERMQQEVEPLLIALVQDSSLPALPKLQRFFAILNRYKTAQKAFFLELLHVWYADGNAIVRQKMRAAGVKWITPWVVEIIHQGIQEGVFMTSYPDEVGEVVLSLVQSLGDALAELLLRAEPSGETLGRMERTTAAYSDALERVLGAPKASLQLVDTQTLSEWFVSARDNA
jgi:AcrR family transcriptional regulator